MSGDAMKLPRWWPGQHREARKMAEQSEADAARVHVEVILPLQEIRMQYEGLRDLRQVDHVADMMRRDRPRWMKRGRT